MPDSPHGYRSLQQLALTATREALAAQQPDGSVGTAAWAPMRILAMAHCYCDTFEGNEFHQDQRLLEAIIRLGDFNHHSCDARGHYRNIVPGYDEWRTFAWMEAMERVRPQLSARRLQEWSAKFVGAGGHMLAIIPEDEMPTFDGAIPNHAIWAYALMYRTGQLYGRADYVDTADRAFVRILASQTPDGCFREMGSGAGFQGTPVTGYNLVSLLAVNLYHAYSGNAAALTALERGWHWWYDFLFPDYSMPGCLDSRMHYSAPPNLFPFLPAEFLNRPEGRWIFERCKSTDMGGNGLGFLMLQYPYVKAGIAPQEPTWPEYHRMTAGEACIRRRHNWTVVMSGLANDDMSSVEARLWSLERQQVLNLHHRHLGLLLGSGHSFMDPGFSTFVFYESGAAWYLHNRAYLKSTPALDTLLLRYGTNIGCLSVDSQAADCAEIFVSLHAERGKRTKPGRGHPLTAMGADVQLPLALRPGQEITCAGATYQVGQAALRVPVAIGQTLDLGCWQIESVDASWELRWPRFTHNPYALLQDDQPWGILCTTLYARTTEGPTRPSATLRLRVLA